MREQDRANYTCVAENVANRRLSPPARIQVVGKEEGEYKSANRDNSQIVALIYYQAANSFSIIYYDGLTTVRQNART